MKNKPVKRVKPRERIMEIATAYLEHEKAKGMMLFPRGIHEMVLLEAIIDYLDEEHEKSTYQIKAPRGKRTK